MKVKLKVKSLVIKRELIYEIGRFIVVGIPGSVLLYATYKLLLSFGTWESVSYNISQLSNSAFNYPMHKKHTFHYKSIYHEELLSRYHYVFNAFAQVTICTPLLEYLAHSWHFSDLMTLLILSIPKTTINYAIAKLIVFKS